MEREKNRERAERERERGEEAERTRAGADRRWAVPQSGRERSCEKRVS